MKQINLEQIQKQKHDREQLRSNYVNDTAWNFEEFKEEQDEK
jgi:hypothetical protein